MEPLSSLAIGYAADKLAEIGERIVSKHVIERWTRRRAVEFYRTFCEALLFECPEGADLEAMLDDLLADEARSEIVFEAYRLVCLARSRTIGPRIIALVVAQIVQRDGVADDEEEALLAAAEQLSDGEFADLRTAMAQLPEPNKWGDIEVAPEKRQIDSNSSGDRVETSHGSLVHTYGTWAEKLKALGLVTESVSEQTFRYKEDSERYIDMDGSVREIAWSVCFHSGSARLAKLVQRVSGGSAK